MYAVPYPPSLSQKFSVAVEDELGMIIFGLTSQSSAKVLTFSYLTYAEYVPDFTDVLLIIQSCEIPSLLVPLYESQHSGGTVPFSKP